MGDFSQRQISNPEKMAFNPLLPYVPLSEVQNCGMEGDNQTDNSDSDRIVELEQLFGQKTFTRVEFDRLVELLRSRTVEKVEHENNDKKKGKTGLSVPENGIGSSRINENLSVSGSGLTLAKQTSKSDDLEVKSTSEANGVSNVPTPSKDAMHGWRSENTAVSNSVALPAVKKPAFRIAAPEYLMELDDYDEYLPRPSTTPNDDTSGINIGEQSGSDLPSAISAPTNWAEGYTIDKSGKQMAGDTFHSSVDAVTFSFGGAASTGLINGSPHASSFTCPASSAASTTFSEGPVSSFLANSTSSSISSSVSSAAATFSTASAFQFGSAKATTALVSIPPSIQLCPQLHCFLGGSVGVSPFGSATSSSNHFTSSSGVVFSSSAINRSSFAPASTTGPFGVSSQATTSSIFSAASNSSTSVSTALSFGSSAFGSYIRPFTFGSSSSLSTSPFTGASSSVPSTTTFAFGLSSGARSSPFTGASSSGSSSTSFTFRLSSGSSSRGGDNSARKFVKFKRGLRKK